MNLHAHILLDKFGAESSKRSESSPHRRIQKLQSETGKARSLEQQLPTAAAAAKIWVVYDKTIGKPWENHRKMVVEWCFNVILPSGND